MEKCGFRGSDKRSEHVRPWEEFSPGESSLGISKSAGLLSVPRTEDLGNTAKRESRIQSEARGRAACLRAVHVLRAAEGKWLAILPPIHCLVQERNPHKTRVQNVKCG